MCIAAFMALVCSWRSMVLDGSSLFDACRRILLSILIILQIRINIYCPSIIVFSHTLFVLSFFSFCSSSICHSLSGTERVQNGWRGESLNGTRRETETAKDIQFLRQKNPFHHCIVSFSSSHPAFQAPFSWTRNASMLFSDKVSKQSWGSVEDLTLWCIGACPFRSCGVMFGSITNVQSRNVRHQWGFENWVREQGINVIENLENRKED